jgi:hypothetical protein
LSRKEEGSLASCIVARFRSVRKPPGGTIIFIPFSPDQCKPGFDWAACSELLLRWCPLCLINSIIGHGWRCKQAHDDSHDWIKYRRGRCKLCKRTFSLLPAFSLPYTQYSLVARSQALRRRFLEHRSWEGAAQTLKDPDRLPDPSTRRLWLMVRPQQTGPSATCLSQLPRQRIEVAIARSTSGQCVSFAFRSGGQSHQLGAFSDESGEKSVAPVTVGSDRDQFDSEAASGL